MLGLSPLIPAYGRDYKSIKALKLDFDADMDFQTPSGSVTNKTDLLKLGMAQIQVRYNNIRKVGMLKISGPIVPIVKKEETDKKEWKPLKKISLKYYENNQDNMIGICTNCSKKTSHVEEDIENYKCSRCGENCVQGLGTLLFLGYVS